MKKYLLLTVLCLMASVCFAQRKQTTDDYVKGAVETIPYSNMPGKITYGYIIGEDGTVLKDGALSIKCGLTNYKYTLSPYVVTLNGSFTLNTTYAKGRLNGAFSSYYKLNVTGTTFLGASQDGISSSMTGNFVNGVPHGAFKVTRNGALKTTLTANYKNGILVGPFACSLLDDDSRSVKYSGTLTQSGKFTGAWKLDDVNAVFQNGVLISSTHKNVATKPAVSELAKQYAAGNITKEQLLKEKWIAVKTKKETLGDYARIAIFRDSGVEFKEIGGWDFTIPNEIAYEVLEEVAILTDVGFEKLANVYKAHHLERATSYPDADFLCRLSITDEFTTAPYVCVNANYKDCFSTNNASPYGGMIDAYIPYEKFKALQDEVDQVLVARAVSVKEFARDGIGRKQLRSYLQEDISSLQRFSGDDWDLVIKSAKRCLEEIETNAYQHPSNENILIYQADISDGGMKYYVRKDSLDEYAEIVKNIETDVKKAQTASAWTLKDLMVKHCGPGYLDSYLKGELAKDGYFSDYDWSQFIQAVKYSYEQFSTGATQHPTNEDIVVYRNYYVRKDSLDEYAEIVKNIENYINQRKLQRVQKDLQKVVDFILANKTKTSIAFDAGVGQYFYHPTMYDFRLDFDGRLKSFCPIVGCEIVDIDNEYITCKMTKQGKKKALISYEIALAYKDGKLNVESFDFSKAKILE